MNPRFGDVGFRWGKSVVDWMITEGEEIIDPTNLEPPEHCYLVLSPTTIFQADEKGIGERLMPADDSIRQYISPFASAGDEVRSMASVLHRYEGKAYGYIHLLGFLFKLVGLPNLLPGDVCSTICADYLRGCNATLHAMPRPKQDTPESVYFEMTGKKGRAFSARPE